MNAYAASEVRSMPRVTLYVKDDDAPIWERAKALAGAGDESLSSLVSDALRARVEVLEAQQKIEAGEVATVTLTVGESPRKVRFTGRLLASEDLDGTEAQIYQMRDGQIVFYREHYQGNAYETYDSLDAFKDSLDARALAAYTDLLQEAYDAVGEEFIIDLD